MSDRTREPESGPERDGDQRTVYLRFGAMIATSTLVMFALAYANVFAVEHVRFSEERVYMALLMGSAMAIVMLSFMRHMYPNRMLNVGIVLGASALGGIALFLSQSQILVEDRAYMRGMIPHHSIAILTSERAGIRDVRVRELADEIIRAQRREIAEMDWLISDIGENGLATTQAEAQARPAASFAATP